MPYIENVVTEIKSKNGFKITSALYDYASKKIEKVLNKHCNYFSSVVITMSVENGRHLVEATGFFLSNGTVARAEEESQDMYASLDLAIDKLERQIRKYKTRLKEKDKKGTGEMFAYMLNEKQLSDEFSDADMAEDGFGRITKNKKFIMKPMSVDEAISQLELLSHSFFLFMDGETMNMSVVYKRKDGNYGLIESYF